MKLDLLRRALVFVAACGLAHATLAIGKPVPTRPQTIEPETIEAMNGPTNWGDLLGNGDEFSIDNHPQWYAVGRKLPNGKWSVLWTWRNSGEPCPGVYELKDAKLIGLWGWSNRGVRIDESGELTGGPIYVDITHPLAKTPDPAGH